MYGPEPHIINQEQSWTVCPECLQNVLTAMQLPLITQIHGLVLLSSSWQMSQVAQDHMHNLTWEAMQIQPLQHRATGVLARTTGN